MPRIALVTDERWVVPRPGNRYVENIFEEDRLLAAALARRGIDVLRVAWSDASVDWAAFEAAVLRTTWDYHERIEAFGEWIETVDAATRLIHPAPLVRWNWDKHYLGDLRAAGVCVVPSVFVECGQSLDLEAMLEGHGWDEAIIKPTVSGAARDTHRIGRAQAASHQQMVESLLQRQSLIVQPFMRDVIERGEVSVIAFEGAVTHGVCKRPAPGDFRVQDDHGGTVSAHVVTSAEAAFVHEVLAACPMPTTYARVDFVRDGQGGLALMELELIEPELWLRVHPPAADAFARALVALLERGANAARPARPDRNN